MNKILQKLSPALKISLVILFMVTVFILFKTEGNFTYTLDDPYIHLKVTQNLALGHYGLNLSEYSAPSSSIIWPFLFVPFAFFKSIFEYTPLIVNIICALLSVVVLERIFSYLPLIKRTCIVIFIMLFCNLYGLVFTGLEHSLQLLLVIYITFNMVYIENIKNNTVKWLTFVAIFLLPLVRYEGLGLTVPVLVYFYTKGYKKEAIICFFATILAICAFSFFLYVHNLGYLPTSILIKTLVPDDPSRIGVSVWKNRYYNIKDNFKELYWLYIISVGVFAYFFTRNRALGYVVLGSSLLHLLFGKYGWFGRYEVYQLTFVVIMALFILFKQSEVTMFNLLMNCAKRTKNFIISLKEPQHRNSLYIASVLAVFALVQTVLSKNDVYDKIFYTPLGASNVYHQQGQMARITQMLDDVVAVNDIGLVSLKSKHDILDVYGLASMEVFKHRLKNPKKQNLWIEKIVKQKNIQFVMIYAQWFPKVPKNWTPVAYLRLNQERITPAFDLVTLYATNPKAVRKMVRTLRQYSKMYPSKRHKVYFINGSLKKEAKKSSFKRNLFLVPHYNLYGVNPLMYKEKISFVSPVVN